MQHSYEATIAKKENDLSSLLQSIRQTESQTEDVKEFQTKMGESFYVVHWFLMKWCCRYVWSYCEQLYYEEYETGKRRAAEEKLRNTLVELAQANEKVQELYTQLEESKKYGRQLEGDKFVLSVPTPSLYYLFSIILFIVIKKIFATKKKTWELNIRKIKKIWLLLPISC